MGPYNGRYSCAGTLSFNNGWCERAGLGALVLCLLGACGAPPRPVKDKDQLALSRQAFARQNNASYDAMLATMINIIMAYDRMKALFTLAFLVDEMAELDGVQAEFRHVFIPDHATVPADVTQLDDKAIIRSLVDLGYRMGADPANWTAGAPQVHRLPERKGLGDQ